MAEPWFDPNMFGAVFGSVVGGGGGTLGGLWGAAAGTCAQRGIGRAWIIGSGWAIALMGAAIAGFGVFAFVSGQPFHIWFWPVQTGGLIAILMGLLVPIVRKRFDEAEQRRMAAEQLRTS
ncbi:MAG: hypothetical protein U0746_06775 [Gemmataceae bacterium]